MTSACPFIAVDSDIDTLTDSIDWNDRESVFDQCSVSNVIVAFVIEEEIDFNE